MARTEGSKNRDFPCHTLEQALVIVQAIVDKGASKEMDRLLVAQAVGRTPASSEFKKLLSSSLRYGLTTGTEKADFIVPTPLGLKIAAPENAGDIVAGKVEACLKPELLGQILKHYNRSKWPDTQFLRNTLEKTFKVDRSHSDDLAKLLVANSKFCGILQDISGSEYIRIEQPVATPQQDQDPLEPDAQDEIASIDPANISSHQLSDDKPPKLPEQTQSRKQLFVAHGKNRKPLEDLKKILNEFKIPYKVAVDEPNKGRPISAKVAELMKECSAGVFIFTRDEQFFKKGKNEEMEEVWRPSENVVYELGAAAISWDRKIIILREDGVNFPSDFNDLGYISFRDGELSNQALGILKELVALELVKFQAA